MAKNVTSVAVEFGVKLDKFKSDLEAAGDLSKQAQRVAVQEWVKGERKKVKAAEKSAKDRVRADKKAQQATERARQASQAQTRAMLAGLPVVGSVAAAMDTFGDAVKAAKVQVFGMQVALAPMLAAATAVAAIGSVFTAMGADAHKARTEVASLNQVTGLLPETLGGIALAGGDELLGKMGEAAGEAQKRIADAAMGTGEARLAFDRLGVSVKDSAGNLRATDAVVRDFVSAVQDVESPTQQAAEMTALFGGAGRELNAALGSKNLEEWSNLTSNFGYDYGPAAMKATNDWNRATKVFGSQLQSLKSVGVRALGFLANRINEVGMGIAATRAIFRAFTTGNFTGAMDMAREAVKEYQVVLQTAAQSQQAVTGGGAATAGAVGAVGDAADDSKEKLEGMVKAVSDALFMGGLGVQSFEFAEVVDATDEGPVDSLEDKAKRAIAAVGMFNEQTMGMIDAIGELTVRRFGENSAKTKKVMRDLFHAQKAVAISNVVIAGAQAFMQAFATGGAVLAGIMAPIIAANSALQIAVIAGEQPSFHTGGIVPGQAAAPDEVGITALSGEGVVSRRGMAALDAINRGDGMGGASPIVVYGARVFNQVDADLVRLPGSSVSRAIRSKTRRRIGHRQ